jgi:anhydro-N-acetylmuramic acid kinase
MSKPHYYIGLMSGTSADGIDLALVDFSTGKPHLVATSYTAYSDEVRSSITSLYHPSQNSEIDKAFALDKQLAVLFAEAIKALLASESLASEDIIAIGNHGQTIRHRPKSCSHPIPFTLQIGCCQTLACLTDIDVIGHFRQKDIALGGQGAPLVPAFHQQLIEDFVNDTFIVNIGGIANITFLPAESKQPIVGFDTGPGNSLMDEWFQTHQQGRYDQNGHWAGNGNKIQSLLDSMLSDPYFNLPAPKSTGREYFTLNWLKQYIQGTQYSAVDIQRTLCELTAQSIADDVKSLSKQANVYLCGGGVHNRLLYNLLEKNLNNYKVNPISALGINGDALEAVAFSWLAYAYKKNIYSNTPSVTGARKSTTLGVLFKP